MTDRDNIPSEQSVDDTDCDPITQVKDSDGELVLDYDSRIGARPYARYVTGDWQLMSLSHVPTPNYGMDDPDTEHGIDTTVHTVALEPDPNDWAEDELRHMAKQPRHPDGDVDGWPGVQVIPVEDSPFTDRDKIPAREDIVTEIGCNSCGNMFRQYLPDPFETCPHCDTELPHSLQTEPNHEET